MSAMADMSKAIRTTLQQHAPTITDLPDNVLEDFRLIVTAFAMDLRDEVERRAKVDAA